MVVGVVPRESVGEKEWVSECYKLRGKMKEERAVKASGVMETSKGF